MQGIRITSYLIIVVLFVLFIYLLVKGILEVKKAKCIKTQLVFQELRFFHF